MKTNVFWPLGVALNLLVVLGCVCGQARGQTKIADSLKLNLGTHVGPSRVDVLHSIAYELVDTDYDSAIFYARKAFQGAITLGDSVRIVKAGRLHSLAFRRLNYMDSSLILSLKILPIARRLSLRDEIKYILNGLGRIYFEQAKYDKALECHLESLDLRRADGDDFDISVAENNLGLVYYKLTNYDSALVHFGKAIEHRKTSDLKYDFASLLINAAIANAQLRRFQNAFNFLNEALSYCSNDCSNDVLLQAFFTKGVIALMQGNISVARDYFHKSLLYAVQAKDERFELDNIAHLVGIYIEQGNVEMAEKYLDVATEKMKYAGTSYNLEFMDIYDRLIQLHLKLNNTSKVVFYQRLYIELQDSLFSEELANSLMTIQAKHIETENRLKMDSQNKILALNNEVIKRQKFLNVFMGIIAVLLVVISVLLIRSNKQKAKLNFLLDKKVQERTHELQVNQTLLERACIERDLLIDRIFADTRTCLATIKGLCVLGERDKTEAYQYLYKVDSTSEVFRQNVEKLSNIVQSSLQKTMYKTICA
jgi:tetratricopeptide (TPR) repeat protein